jgi:predicted molibdopterin-dependent oxidoreductase YjgC
MDPKEDRRHIAIHQENGKVCTRSVPLDFFGDLQTEYEKRNQDYMEEEAVCRYSQENPEHRFVEPKRFDCAASESGAGQENLPYTAKAAALKESEFHAEPVPSSVRPIRYDQEKCIGCNRCASVCQCDILLPSVTKGEHPVILYPGECYYCGACVMVCPKPGAITLCHPLMNRAKFVPVKPEHR